MKRLSDYKNDEALELWGDIIEPMSEIITDEEVRKAFQNGTNITTIVKMMLKKHPKDVSKILLRIDPTPFDGVNVIARLVNVFIEFMQDKELKSFFGFAEPKKQKKPTGSATESIKDGVK